MRSDVDLVPVEPPYRAGGPSRHAGGARPLADYPAVARFLRANPHQWFRVCVATGRRTRVAERIRSGDIPSFRPAGMYDAAQRRINDREIEIVACYLGDKRVP